MDIEPIGEMPTKPDKDIEPIGEMAAISRYAEIMLALFIFLK